MEAGSERQVGRRVEGDPSASTVGWNVYGSGTIGITRGQTLRLSVVNLGPSPARAVGALTGNPRPVSLLEEWFTLEPGEGREFDLRAEDLSEDLVDKTRRTQVRALIRASGPFVYCNLEIFDDDTGITGIVLPLRAIE
jgi:hypothetical protein